MIYNMTNIKPYEQITVIESFNWETVKTKASIDELNNLFNQNKFIKLNGELWNTASIKKAKTLQVDELESFILSQPEETQKKIREKKKRLKDTMWKEMTLKYAQNFVKNYC